ncbi:hypothetical protein BC826DRAFT_1034300 [Russula brevipes]|nr:hypothetical protein BC826DRAFT_1034300 [Russula brevipes]
MSNAHQNWNTTENGGEGNRSIFQPRGPPGGPSATHIFQCRFPGCGRRGFFDRRVNEVREWCGDGHMRAAILNRVEKPCTSCMAWPRRKGYSLCSVDACKYPGQ